MSDARIIERRLSPLSGRFVVPGDKSLSHRAVLFASLAAGTSRLTGVLDSEDVRASISVCRLLGAGIEVEAGSVAGTIDLVVTGWGDSGPTSPDAPLDCGNSGTTARLLLGMLSGRGIDATIIGDDSLITRPMRRVTDPLTAMGSSIRLSEAGTLPAAVHAVDGLTSGDFSLAIASAQVKSAILLAGLAAKGRTSVTEPSLSRDHTERMLPLFGVPVEREGLTVSIDGPTSLAAADVVVPGDPSSAAFLAVAAALIPDSDITIERMSLNPTRTGFLDVMRAMGADVEVVLRGGESEPYGDVTVRFTPSLVGTTVESEAIPGMIDEIIVLSLLATAASTPTRFKGVAELRVKESDRLAAIVQGISAFGGEAREEGDELVIEPRPITHGHRIDPLGDHRLAMAWGVAGLVVGSVGIVDAQCANVSFPGFFELFCE